MALRCFCFNKDRKNETQRVCGPILGNNTP